MTESQEKTGELADISEVYELLARDVKSLIEDLYSGIHLFKFVACMLAILAAVILAQSLFFLNDALFLLGISIALCAALLGGEYLAMKRKYGRLYKTAKEKL